MHTSVYFYRRRNLFSTLSQVVSSYVSLTFINCSRVLSSPFQYYPWIFPSDSVAFFIIIYKRHMRFTTEFPMVFNNLIDYHIIINASAANSKATLFF